MRSIHFDPDAWEDLLYWLGADRKMAKRITRLIGEIQRDPFTGIGKPEPLKGDLSGYWTRRIDDEHRLVYRADDKEVKILKARYHYSDLFFLRYRLAYSRPDLLPPAGKGGEVGRAARSVEPSRYWRPVRTEVMRWVLKPSQCIRPM